MAGRRETETEPPLKLELLVLRVALLAFDVTAADDVWTVNGVDEVKGVPQPHSVSEREPKAYVGYGVPSTRVSHRQVRRISGGLNPFFAE